MTTLSHELFEMSMRIDGGNSCESFEPVAIILRNKTLQPILDSMKDQYFEYPRLVERT